MKRRIMSVDLEPDFRSKYAISLVKVVPKLLDFFDSHNIKATFFTVSSLLERHEDLIREISKKHEIASHSHTHNFLNPVNSSWEINHSKKKFEEYGFKCDGFRAPGFVVTKDHLKIVKDAGYKYDSSIAKYYPGRYNNFGSPSKVYEKDGLKVVPIPNMVYPMIDSGLTYLKAFHPVSKVFAKPYMFYLHPWEFLERKDLVKAKGVSGRLLLRNSGARAVKIFKEYVEKSNCKWTTVRDYIR
jgi:peptidoglycan/xylan/chitin deacetylase (PgdA/CDA1 family)